MKLICPKCGREIEQNTRTNHSHDDIYLAKCSDCRRLWVTEGRVLDEEGAVKPFYKGVIDDD